MAKKIPKKVILGGLLILVIIIVIVTTVIVLNSDKDEKTDNELAKTVGDSSVVGTSGTGNKKVIINTPEQEKADQEKEKEEEDKIPDVDKIKEQIKKKKLYLKILMDDGDNYESNDAVSFIDITDGKNDLIYKFPKYTFVSATEGTTVKVETEYTSEYIPRMIKMKLHGDDRIDVYSVHLGDKQFQVSSRNFDQPLPRLDDSGSHTLIRTGQ